MHFISFLDKEFGFYATSLATGRTVSLVENIVKKMNPFRSAFGVFYNSLVLDVHCPFPLYHVYRTSCIERNYYIIGRDEDGEKEEENNVKQVYTSTRIASRKKETFPR